jgi:hypothetical protein
MNSEARRLGVTIAENAIVSEIPPSALLKGYRIAQFTAFGFGMLGKFKTYIRFPPGIDTEYAVLIFSVIALIVVVVFLHGIGVVGAQKKKEPTGTEEAQPIDESKSNEKQDEKEESR